MTMKKYQIMMMDELNAGNIETYNDMNKCLRESNYDARKAYIAYINITEDAFNTPPISEEEANDEFV